MLAAGLWGNAMAAEFCSDTYYIDVTLANGARWDMCWEHRNREGIVLHHIHYTPSGDQRRMVLRQASIAQIHVPYDDNGARYHDVSDYGLGGGYMHNIAQADCPQGTLIGTSGTNYICRQVLPQGYSYKYGDESAQSEALSLFSVSHVGAYNYMPQWKFFDNGTIEPWMGATGSLQRFGSNPSHGWQIDATRIGISHAHNFFWKLDFDLNGSSDDDYVEEINIDAGTTTRTRTMTRFYQEAKRSVDPSRQRSWRIVDPATNTNGHPLSYEILLIDSGHKVVGPSYEAFTHNDFYVTRRKSCERYASHNPTADGCADDLDGFVNDESIDNQDIVLWAGLTFYHVPRTEDAPKMDAHWNHFQIVPRDFHPENPVSGGTTNTPPSIAAIGAQSTTVGASVSLAVMASDADGDTLTYSASGLPAGLAINGSTGVIGGAPTTAGSTSVTINVSDGTDTARTSFNWTISEPPNNPPVVSSIANQSTTVGTSVSLAVTASDADGDTLTYSASGLPAGLAINGSTGVISGAPTTAGSTSVTIKVSDGTDTTSIDFTWTVNAVVTNTPPNLSILTPSSGAIFTSGDAVSLSAIATDAEDDDATLTAGIVWSSDIDGALGVGDSLTPSNLSVGVHVITASATDNDGATTDASITLTIEAETWTTVANYQTDYQASSPAAGWSYAWNQHGPIGTAGDYADLMWSAYRYDSDGIAGGPDNTENRFGYLRNTGGHAGGGVNQNGTTDRYVIAGYEVAADAKYRVAASTINHTGCQWTNGLQVDVYVNDTFITQTAVPTDNSAVSFDAELGLLAAGDTIYIGVGPNGRDGCDAFQWDYTIEHSNAGQGNARPAVNITAPADGSAFAQGEAIAFTAAASDLEDDDVALTDDIIWLSNLDGELGSSGTLNSDTLSVGTHTITATVTDSDGATAETSIVVDVVAGAWELVAAYRQDFQGSTPTTGWRYYWNANGPLGDVANYEAYLWNGYYYDSDGASGADGNENAYGRLRSTGGHPGRGVNQGASTDRYVIAAYTAAADGDYRISASSASHSSCQWTNGIDLQVYVNDTQITQVSIPADGSNVTFDSSLGALTVGDRIYVAAGPNSADGCDGFQWDYQIDYNAGVPTP